MFSMNELNHYKPTNLTNFVKEHSNEISECINFPLMKNRPDMVLERSMAIRGHEALIGTVYDYAFRFMVEYSKNKNVDEVLYNAIGFKMEDNPSKLVMDYRELAKKSNFDAIVDLSLKLGVNEVHFRSGTKLHLHNFKYETISAIKEEVKNLVKVSIEQIQKCKEEKNIIYNPVFGINNISADGDMIIGKTLIDFKATSSLQVNEYLKQLVGYIGLNYVDKRFNIEKVALYYPRFKYFPEYLVKDLIKDKNKLVNLFQSNLIGY